MRAAGLDGYVDGWVAVVLDGDRFERAAVFGQVTAALAALDDCDRIGVDMPIGLVERGWRQADLAARRAAGSARSSVFLTPPRLALTAPTYDQASRRSRTITGKGVSKQAWALRRRILELEAEQPLAAAVLEVHPEVAFRSLARADLASKRSWSGVRQRLGLLQAVGIDVPADVPDGARCRPDDVLDAAVAAWVAGAPPDALVALPEDLTDHAHGRPVAIWSRRR